MSQINRRKIGLWSAVALVTGNLVGSGAFMLPASLASFGSISMFSWFFTSAGAVTLAMIFAKLSMRVTKTGGPHVFAREAFGDNVGFFVAWGYWMLTWIGNAAIVVAMYGYLNMLCDGFFSAFQLFLIGVFVILAISYINLQGIKEASFVQILTTLLKLVPMVFVPLVALFAFDVQNLTPFVPEGKTALGAFNAAALLTLWSFVGIESATVPAEEVSNPKKTIPRATLIGTSIAAVVYIIGNFALIGAIPSDLLAGSTAPYALAAQLVLGGAFWSKVVALSAVVCCIGTLNGWMLVVGQIPLGAANDGLFPKWFGQISANGVPTAGILVSAVCMIVILLMSFDPELVKQFDFIAELATTTILLVFVVMLFSYAALILKESNRSISDKTTLFLGACYTIWTLWGAGIKMLGLSSIVIISGLPVYFYVRKNFKKNQILNGVI